MARSAFAGTANPLGHPIPRGPGLCTRCGAKPSQAITRNRPPACWAQSAQRSRPRASAWHSAAYAAMRLAEAPNARGPSRRTSLAGQGGGALAHPLPAAPDFTRYAAPPRWPTEASAASRSSSLFSPRTFSVNKIICGRSLRRLARFWLSFLDRVEFLSPIPWLRGREGRRALWGICAGHQVLRRQPLRIACARMPLSWLAAEPRAKTHWPARSPLGNPCGALSGKTRHPKSICVQPSQSLDHQL